MKTILVCGGRSYDKWTILAKELDRVCLERGWMREPDQYGNSLPDVKIVNGGADGADSLATDWAVINWCPFIEYPANWNKYGKSAGPRRNKQMLDNERIDLVIAFPGGNGTKDMVTQAKDRNLEVIEIE